MARKPTSYIAESACYEVQRGLARRATLDTTVGDGLSLESLDLVYPTVRRKLRSAILITKLRSIVTDSDPICRPFVVYPDLSIMRTASNF